MPTQQQLNSEQRLRLRVKDLTGEVRRLGERIAALEEALDDVRVSSEGRERDD